MKGVLITDSNYLECYLWHSCILKDILKGNYVRLILWLCSRDNMNQILITRRTFIIVISLLKIDDSARMDS